MRHTLGVLFIACNLFLGSAKASNGKASSVSISAQGDSHRTQDLNISADVYTDRGFHVFGSLGRTHIPPSEDQTETLDSRDVVIGGGTDPQKELSVSGLLGLWGQGGKISTARLEGRCLLSHSDWELAFIPGYRSINVKVGGQAPSSLRSRGDTLIIQNPYLGIEAGYFVGSWEFRGGATGYRYSEAMDALYNPEYAPYFSQSVVLQVSGFPRFTAFADGTYVFRWGALGLEVSQQLSAIDDSKSTTLAFHSVLTAVESWEFEVELGRTSYDSGSNQFAGLTVSYLWDRK